MFDRIITSGTPCSASASRANSNSSLERGLERSSPSTLAPRDWPLGITFAMSRLRSALGAHGVLDYADALDLAAHPVAGLEESGRPHEVRHPGRRAGGDDVAGKQRHRLAAVGHQLFNPEVEVGSVAVLPHLAVHLGAHPERPAPLELVQGHEGGAGRAERVVALADE